MAVSALDQVTHPSSAPEALVEDAGREVHHLWWDDRDDSLWWADLAGGSLQRLNFQTGIQSVVYEGAPVSAFLPQEDGTWLLFRDKDIALFDFDRHVQVSPLLENVRVDGDRFTEARADSRGRAFVGTVRAGRPNGAGIYRLTETGTLAKVLGGTGEVSGMCWNGAGDVLYWCCATTRTICRCHYDAKRGALTNRQVFHECLPEEGTPTGLALDTEGTLWSARRGAGVILKIGENRRLMGQITFPARDITSVVFGGTDRRTVLVSAMTEEGRSKIFILKSAVAGMPLHRTRIEAKPRPVR